jgi:hypothetical protein
MGSIAKVLASAGVCFAFAIGHLQLQFAVSDLEQETNRLQARKLELHSRLNQLKSEVESNKRGDRLLQYGRAELGMISSSPADREVVYIDPEINERYAHIEVARSARPRRAIDPAGETWTGEIASRLLEAGSAFATSAQAGDLFGEKSAE